MVFIVSLFDESLFDVLNYIYSSITIIITLYSLYYSYFLQDPVSQVFDNLPMDQTRTRMKILLILQHQKDHMKFIKELLRLK